MTKSITQLSRLLAEIFQLDQADLDFGIYRIMNYKRDVIERFIKDDLAGVVSEELDRGAVAEQAQAIEELNAVTKQIAETMGEDALDADGELADKYHGTPLGRRYQELKARAGSRDGREAFEAAIFNHLHTFFSRYYQEGDFISKRRYSRQQKYAIPYSGEETYLYWANNDQYYVKTTEHFRDYSYTSRGVTVHFQLAEASVEQNNVKGAKRCFVPRLKEVRWEEDASELVIPFEYRPLNKQEEITYGSRSQQEGINDAVLAAVPKDFKNNEQVLVALTADHHTTDDRAVSTLEHHLRQYTRRNTSDYFIHKDLAGFLSRELDFYLKNEVLNLDEIGSAGEERGEAWFQVMLTIKALGTRIIEFLDQIESFQKMLWEKRKFITETHYCVTVGNIEERFYSEIVENEAQWEEWKELFCVDRLEKDLFSGNVKSKEGRSRFLNAHPTLVLDTKHFSTLFVDRLLASYTDLDTVIDGILVDSENLQAMELLSEKYQSAVHCMYWDPPYNTGKDDFLYKDGYRHSSWLSMIYDRAISARHLLADDGLFTSSIGDDELDRLRLCLSAVFGRDNMLANFVWNNEGNIDNQSRVKENHEYILAFCRDEASYPHAEVIAPDIGPDSKLYNDTIENSITKNGPGNPPSEVRLPEGFPATFEEGDLEAQEESWPHLRDRVVVKDSSLVKPARVYSGWSSRHLLDKYINNDCQPIRDSKGLETWFELTHTGAIYCYKTRERQSHVLSVIRGVGTVKTMSSKLAHMGFAFSYPKPIDLIEYVCRWTNHSDAVILDCFAGSGTTGQAVIRLNREDGGHRKFILMEMGDYFDAIVLPRIKKVTFSPEWKDEKPQRMATPEEAERSPRIVKYIRLESYEDALNNLEFDEDSGQESIAFEDYLLRYMLRWETRHSETLLNIEKLSKPFAYQLHIHKGGETRGKVVDIPETFSYLIGLRVQTRRAYEDAGRRYLVYRGEVDHRQVVVIWRETEGWEKTDLEQDRDFVAEQKLTEGADEVFVNGDSFVPGARALEPLFKARMFSAVS